MDEVLEQLLAEVAEDTKPQPSAVYSPARGLCALVTSGHTGIGRAVALEFARQGMHVAFSYPADPDGRAEKDARRTAVELARLEVKVYWRACDVGDALDAGGFVAEAVEALGGMHVLVNGAASAAAAVAESEPDRALRATNLTGAFRMIRALSPIFRKQRYGKIVSISAAFGSRSELGLSVPAASTGLVGLTRAAAIELGPYNVNVNAVAPGCVRTDVSDRPGDSDDGESNWSALRRVGEARDVANVVVFLCSDLARHVTGAVIPVDGGRHL